MLKPTDTLLEDITDKNNMTSTPSIQWSDIPNDKQDLTEIHTDNSDDRSEITLHKDTRSLKHNQIYGDLKLALVFAVTIVDTYKKNCTSILDTHGSHNSPPHNGKKI